MTNLKGPETEGLTAKQVNALHALALKMRAEDKSERDAINASQLAGASIPQLAGATTSSSETNENDVFVRWTAKRMLAQTIDDRIASLMQRMVTLTALKQHVNEMSERECATAADFMSMTRDQVL